jgi:hypothetical protein
MPAARRHWMTLRCRQGAAPASKCEDRAMCCAVSLCPAGWQWSGPPRKRTPGAVPCGGHTAATPFPQTGSRAHVQLAPQQTAHFVQRLHCRRCRSRRGRRPRTTWRPCASGPAAC